MNLRKTELEKERDMFEKERMRKEAEREKSRQVALKFEKAEQIRNGHKALKHAKFFN